MHSSFLEYACICSFKGQRNARSQKVRFGTYSLRNEATKVKIVNENNWKKALSLDIAAGEKKLKEINDEEDSILGCESQQNLSF